METHELAECKVVLIGDINVGKTSLSSQYLRKQFPDWHPHTIGAEYAMKTVSLGIRGSVKMQLWDTDGRERFQAVTQRYYRGATGVLVVFDLTRENTFLSVSHWVGDTRQANSDAVLMLVGNKRDLVRENPSLRLVTFENAQSLANSNGMLYMEISALTDAGVNEAFEVLLSAIHQKANETNSTAI